MTPRDTALLIEGWNAAQAAASGMVDPPTRADFDAMVRRYG
ncbi:MAG: hypothetical protein ACK4OP_01160 [Gemmobacter sp.]